MNWKCTAAIFIWYYFSAESKEKENPGQSAHMQWNKNKSKIIYCLIVSVSVSLAACFFLSLRYLLFSIRSTRHEQAVPIVTYFSIFLCVYALRAWNERRSYILFRCRILYLRCFFFVDGKYNQTMTTFTIIIRSGFFFLCCLLQDISAVFFSSTPISYLRLCALHYSSEKLLILSVFLLLFSIWKNVVRVSVLLLLLPLIHI